MTAPVPPFRPDPLPYPAADHSWVTEETIGSSAREDAWFNAIMAIVFVTFVAFIVWLALDSAAENRRTAPHEDRCLLSNGRVVHLNAGNACLIDGRVTDRW